MIDSVTRPAYWCPGATLDDRMPELAVVARDAEVGSRHQRAAATGRLRAAVAALTGTDQSALIPGDIFDPLTGGVRLRSWDRCGRSARALFRLDAGTPDAWQRRLRTDSATLLRGGLYWYPYAMADGAEPAQWVPLYRRFLSDATETVPELTSGPQTLTSVKLLAAIQDMVRGMLLHLSTAAFLLENDRGAAGYPVTRRVLNRLAVHLRDHVDLLTGVADHGRVDGLAPALAEADRTLADADDALALTDGLADPARAARLLRERHSDDLLENVAAIELGLPPLLRDRPGEVIECAGLAAGGIELAVLACMLLRRQGVDASLRLVRLSLYQEGGATVPGRDFTEPDGTRNGPTVIFDDNLMTGRTLDRAVASWPHGRVLGAVVTRYPAPNLAPHLLEHGFPEPRRLLREVRGLITPLPAGRSAAGVRNKSEARVLRYLRRERMEETA